MRKYVNKLRKKPEHIRKQYLIGAMIVSMSLVGGIWIYSLTNRFTSPDMPQKTQADLKPFVLFSQGVQSAYKGVTTGGDNTNTDSQTSNTQDTKNIIPINPAENSNQ